VRIRQIKPEYWRDEPLSRLTDGARLFYIGLWQLSDDGGWLRWNVSEIGTELYGYRGRARRENDVRRYAEALIHLDGGARLVINECGHAYLPRLERHQRFGGRPVYTTRDAHARDCARLRADAPDGKVGKGRVGKGKVGDDSPNLTNLPVDLVERLREKGLA
jgi:hypothetical protein